MTSKSRERLIKFGMLQEYENWKVTLLSKPKEKFSIGSKVRLKRDYLNVPIGSLGKVVETNPGYVEGILQIKLDRSKFHDIPLYSWELETYLEEI